MTWLIENDAFADGDILLPTLHDLQKDVILWNDDFWQTKEFEQFPKKSAFYDD